MKISKSSFFVAALGFGALISPAFSQPKPSMARAITLTGIVAGAPQGGEFFLRANGQTFRVKPLAKVGMKGIRGGDRVRVFGRPTGLRVNFANVRVLVSRASDNPSDYNPAPGTTIQGN